jgi:peptidoglycan/LPS O-acetylase OafA/YrhL
MLLLFTRLNLHSRLWATFGKATFTAYLVHPLVLQTLVMEWKVPNTLIVIALCVPMTLSLGYTWQLIRAKLTALSKPRATSD